MFLAISEKNQTESWTPPLPKVLPQKRPMAAPPFFHYNKDSIMNPAEATGTRTAALKQKMDLMGDAAEIQKVGIGKDHHFAQDLSQGPF